MLRTLLLLTHLLTFDGALAEASELRGTITDSSGRPLAGASVSVLTPQRGVLATVETAADGTFTVPALEPGNYVVVARAEGLEERQAVVGREERLMVAQDRLEMAEDAWEDGDLRRCRLKLNQVAREFGWSLADGPLDADAAARLLDQHWARLNELDK